MADISDSELRKEIGKILKDADLAVWTTKKVIQQLGKQFDADFRGRKAIIDTMVLDFINKMEPESEGSSEEDDESSEEEKPKAKSKPKKKPKEEKIEEDDGGDVSSEDEKPKKRGRRAAPKGRVTKEKGKKGGKGGTGFTRTYKLSPALAELVGSNEMPRHAVVKRIWEIVKTQNLYDPNNKQFAICDDKLYKVIGKQRFRVFGMMKHLKGHFLDD